MTVPDDKETPKTSNFLRQVIERDLEQGTYAQRHWCGQPGDAAHQQAGPLDPARVRTRFPPEPNGYLHVGHAKSIMINFGLAEEFRGECNLRFNDTNPTKEETEYVDAIIEDVKWLGGDFGDRIFYASDYFQQLYLWAVELIKKEKAFVCDLTSDQVRETRGTLTKPGQDSPYRNRS